MQLSPPPGAKVSLRRLGRKLACVGPVSQNRFLVRATIDSYMLTIFPDGRAIIGGTDDDRHCAVRVRQVRGDVEITFDLLASGIPVWPRQLVLVVGATHDCQIYYDFFGGAGPTFLPSLAISSSKRARAFFQVLRRHRHAALAHALAVVLARLGAAAPLAAALVVGMAGVGLGRGAGALAGAGVVLARRPDPCTC